MKQTIKLMTAAITLAGASAQAASVILIAGSDSTDTRNGAFTSLTDNWVTTGTATTAFNTNNTDTVAGSSAGQNIIIGRVTGSGETRHFGQDTGHTLVAGDKFTLSYDWRNASGWGTAETIDAVLFTTADNLIGGTRTVLFTLNSGAETTNNTWETETFAETAAVASAGDGNRKVFISFETNGANAGSFSRMDDVNLSVDTNLVPEPSSTALLGLGGLALILRRRK